MEIEKIKKLLKSSVLEDVQLAAEILHKKPAKYIKQVVEELGGRRVNWREGDYDPVFTYAIKLVKRFDVADEYFTKGRYYCSISEDNLYIDHCSRALIRILEGDTELSVSLQDESSKTKRSS